MNDFNNAGTDLVWGPIYHEDLSFHIEARCNECEYIFTKHVIDRTFERNNNIIDIASLDKPVRRIIKVWRNYNVDDWILYYQFGTKLVIHDVDINMVYIITCNENRYEIVTTYNEFWTKFKNYYKSPELFVSLLNKK